MLPLCPANSEMPAAPLADGADSSAPVVNHEYTEHPRVHVSEEVKEEPLGSTGGGGPEPEKPPPRRRGRPKGSKNKRLSLSASLVPAHLGLAKQRRIGDSNLNGTSAKKAKLSLDSLFADLCGPQYTTSQIPPSLGTAAEFRAAATAHPQPHSHHSQYYEMGSPQRQQQQHYVGAGGCERSTEFDPQAELSAAQQEIAVPVAGDSSMSSGDLQKYYADMPQQTSGGLEYWDQYGSPVAPGSPTLLMSRANSSTSGSPRGVLQPPSPTLQYSLNGLACVSPAYVMRSPPSFVPKISHFERCVICANTGLNNTTAVVCSRRSCQRLFCLNCVSLSAAASPGLSVFNQHVNECIVCVYQSRRKHLTDANQWHFDFRDEIDAQFVRVLRDMLPLGSGLFIEISRTRQPCWRRKLRSGARKHFSFRFYGGILESRLEALEIGSEVVLADRYQHSESGSPAAAAAAAAASLTAYAAHTPVPVIDARHPSFAEGVPFSQGHDYRSASLGLVGLGVAPDEESPSSSSPNALAAEDALQTQQPQGAEQSQETLQDPGDRSCRNGSSPSFYEAAFYRFSEVKSLLESEDNAPSQETPSAASWGFNNIPYDSYTDRKQQYCRPSFSIELIGEPVSPIIPSGPSSLTADTRFFAQCPQLIFC